MDNKKIILIGIVILLILGGIYYFTFFKDDYKKNMGLGEKFMESDYDKAIENFEKAIELKPNMALPYVRLGSAYMRKAHFEKDKDYDKILRLFQKANEINPSLRPYSGMGFAYYEKGNYDLAIDFFQSAIKYNPNNRFPYTGLGWSYYFKTFKSNLSDYSKAALYFNKAKDLEPNYASPLNGLGAIELRLGNYEEAEKYFKKSIELHSTNKMVDRYNSYNGYYLLGLLYYLQGKIDLAKENVEKSLEINPNYMEAVRLYEKINQG